MREPRIGDRYEDSYYKGMTFEVIGKVSKEAKNHFRASIVVIIGNIRWEANIIHEYYGITSKDKYIGNFAKSNKFEELYNILNGTN